MKTFIKNLLKTLILAFACGGFIAKIAINEIKIEDEKKPPTEMQIFLESRRGALREDGIGFMYSEIIEETSSRTKYKIMWRDENFHIYINYVVCDSLGRIIEVYNNIDPETFI